MVSLRHLQRHFQTRIQGNDLKLGANGDVWLMFEGKMYQMHLFRVAHTENDGPIPDATVPDAPMPNAPVPNARVVDVPVPDAPLPDALTQESQLSPAASALMNQFIIDGTQEALDIFSRLWV